MNVEFNEGQPTNYNYPPKKSGLANLIIKTGLAKDEAGTQKVMIVVTVICFALMAYFIFKTF
jgi:hypothetical protein